MKNKQTRGMRKLYALGKKRSIDLSLSENPLGCSPLVTQRLKQINCSFSDYPIPNGMRLKIVISEKISCQIDNIFIDNGSEAIISSIPKALAKPGDEVIVPTLSFPMFSICSELSGLDVQLAPMTEELGIDLEAIKKLVNPKTKLIFICNPNNPTGSVISKKELTEFIKTVPKSALIVVDEANIEFGGESVIELVSTQSNLVVLRTLSKGFGLANLRIGFAVADPQIVTKLEEETPVFPISGLSEDLSISALQDENFIAQTKKFIDQERTRIKVELDSLGFVVFPSQANNLFVKIPNKLSDSTFWTAMDSADISLVKGSSFDGFNDSFFRVSPRVKKINDAFLATAKNIVTKETL